MNPHQQLPTGFGLALLENEQAAHVFYSLSPQEQQAILQRTHLISSKMEMQAFVNRLAESSQPIL